MNIEEMKIRKDIQSPCCDYYMITVGERLFCCANCGTEWKLIGEKGKLFEGGK